jgi:hypothetical protein
MNSMTVRKRWAIAVAAMLVMIFSGCFQQPPRVPMISFPNEPDGFRGIKWGTNIARLPGMELVKNGGAEKYYVRPDDKLKIGDAVIEKITYGFYRDEFFKVMIHFKGLMNYMHMKETLTGLYGDGEHVSFGKSLYTWTGSKVLVVIEFNGTLNEGEVLYTYKPVMEKLTKETGAKPPKGAGDL